MARTPLFGGLRRMLHPRSVGAAGRRGPTRRDLLVGATSSALLGVLPRCATGAPTVAVVGAGLAGLHCAARLAEAGVDVTVFEATNRVGGRLHTGRGLFPDDLLCELGGELIDSNHLTLFALAAELGIALDDRTADLGPDTVADLWWVAGGRVTDSTLAAQFRHVAPAIAHDLARAEHGDAFDRLDRTPLEDYLAAVAPSAVYPELHAVLTAAYRGEFGLEPGEQSALNLHYLIDATTPEPFRIFGDSDERWHAHDGNDTFTTRLAEVLGERVRVGHRLVGVAWDGGRYALTLDAGGRSRSAEADHVVLALPFSVLRDVDLDAPVSRFKRQIIDELGYGTNAKVMAGFSRRVWREDHDATGSATTDLALQQTWDSTIGQAATAAVLTQFLGGDRGVASGEGTAEAWFARVLPDLDAVFPGSAAALLPDSAVRMHWPTVPTSRGSYACYRPGQWSFWSFEGRREGNLHFCGEHTSADWQAWMEGAAETGALVAAEILDDLGLPASAGLRRLVEIKTVVPQPCYHGDRLPRLRWGARRRGVGWGHTQGVPAPSRDHTS